MPSGQHAQTSAVGGEQPGGRTGFVTAAGRRFHYLEWGSSSAPPVVCLHGGGQTAYMYEELAAELRGRYHVLAPDLPGHGDSGPIDVLDRIAFAETLAPFLEEFGISRCALVGASLGGILGITLAAARPELVSALVLIDVGHQLEEDGVRRIMEFMTAHESFASLEEAADAVAAYLTHRRDVNLDNLRRNLRRRDDGRWEWKHDFGRMLRAQRTLAHDWRRVLAGLEQDARRLHCPVLVLRGSASDVLSAEGAEAVAAAIPDARVATIADAGHLAAGDNPASTNARVSSFLAEVGW